jgi:nicotinamide-nucleotide amidase
MTAGAVSGILRDGGLTLAVAESCTGGRLAAAFTGDAGASDFFLGGVVAYANEVKVGALGVYREVLERHGAVSREVALQMAQGVQRLTGAHYTISTTGVAGPGGGTAAKPVGTVWIAVAGPDGAASAKQYRFEGTRAENMAAAVDAAIEMLAAILKNS